MLFYRGWALLFAFVFVLLSFPLLAQEQNDFEIDLSRDVIEISTGFTGDRVTVFGTKLPQADVILIIEGPSRDVVIRRKSQVLGFWMNTKSVRFEDVPAFYDFAADTQVLEKLDGDLIQSTRIGLDYLNLSGTDEDMDAASLSRFQGALVQNKQIQELFPLGPKKIDYLSPRLFRVDFTFPSNIPRGSYRLRALQMENGSITAQRNRILTVQQQGLSAKVNYYAANRPFLYGAFGVLMAVFIGWGATQVLRRD